LPTSDLICSNSGPLGKRRLNQAGFLTRFLGWIFIRVLSVVNHVVLSTDAAPPDRGQQKADKPNHHA
jgi:hypothetical protein